MNLNPAATKLFLCETLNKAKALPEKERVEYLRANLTYSLLMVCETAYHKDIIWDLPPGRPEFNPGKKSLPGLTEANLHNRWKYFRYFIDSANKETPNPGKIPVADRRQLKFVLLLESLPEAESNIILACKDRDVSEFGLTKKVVAELFPHILMDKESPKEKVTESAGKKVAKIGAVLPKTPGKVVREKKKETKPEKKLKTK